MLEDPNTPREVSTVVLSALSEAGTSGAQAALAEALRVSRLRDAATAALYTLQKPELTILAAVHTQLKAAESLSSLSDALLALGALGRLNQGHLTPGKTAADAVLDLEGMARRSGALETWLHAVGNTGAPQARSRLAGYLADSDTELRRAAVFALRFIPGTRETLVRSAVNDSDAGVRVAALRALTYAERPQGWKELSRLAEQDTDPSVRMQAVRVIARHFGREPAGQEVLRRIATRDTSKDVRGVAAYMMGGV